MKRIFLLRHAKSAWPAGVDDHDRPLAERGRAAAPMVGRYMREQGLLPARVLVSTALRTQQTFALVRPELVPGAEEALPAQLEPRIYEAPPGALLTVLQEIDNTVPSAMLVGHNPGIAALALGLLGPDAAETDDYVRLRVKVPTAALIVLDAHVDRWADVAPASAALHRYITPRLLGGIDED